MSYNANLEPPRKGLIRQEIITIEEENGVITKRTNVRAYAEDGVDYLDHMQIENLDKDRIIKEVIRFSKIYFEGEELSEEDLAIVVGKLMERLEIDMNIGTFIVVSWTIIFIKPLLNFNIAWT